MNQGQAVCTGAAVPLSEHLPPGAAMCDETECGFEEQSVVRTRWWLRLCRGPFCDLPDPALTKQNHTCTCSVQMERLSREKQGIAFVQNQSRGLSLMLKTAGVCVQAREKAGKLSAWLLQVVLMHVCLTAE